MGIFPGRAGAEAREDVHDGGTPGAHSASPRKEHPQGNGHVHSVSPQREISAQHSDGDCEGFLPLAARIP